MYDKLSARLVYKMECNRIIADDKVELYQCGLEMLIAFTVNIFTILVLSLVMKEFLSGVVFFAGYAPMRTYLGGYHASTHLRCYMFSVCSFTAFLFIVKYLPANMYIPLSLAFVAAATITALILAPVSTQNKTLDELEVAVYRRRGRIILFIEILIFSGLCLLGEWKITYAVSCSFLFMAVMLIIGKVSLSKAICGEI